MKKALALLLTLVMLVSLMPITVQARVTIRPLPEPVVVIEEPEVNPAHVVPEWLAPRMWEDIITFDELPQELRRLFLPTDEQEWIDATVFMWATVILSLENTNLRLGTNFTHADCCCFSVDGAVFSTFNYLKIQREIRDLGIDIENTAARIGMNTVERELVMIEHEDLFIRLHDFVQELVDGLETDRERVMAINKWLAHNMIYDWNVVASNHGNLAQRHSWLFEALMNPERVGYVGGVCAHFAGALETMLLVIGIPAVVFTNASESHADVAVFLEGAWRPIIPGSFNFVTGSIDFDMSLGSQTEINRYRIGRPLTLSYLPIAVELIERLFEYDFEDVFGAPWIRSFNSHIMRSR
jgi:hypothetical protein